MRRIRPRRAALALVLLIGLGALFFPIGCSVFGIRTVEEAEYQVLRSDGPIEIRRYEPLVQVETTVEADHDEAGDIAFRRLFDYISGNNAGETRIAMTAPVLADDAEGTSIAMTAPVLGERQGTRWRYAFVLPASFTIDTAPRPLDDAVRLVAVPGAVAAAIRYRGSRTEAAMRQHAETLARWIADQGLEPTSPPRSAAYDPPWTIPFLRRNEVLIDLAGAGPE